jgi:hypothetical protein
MEGGGWEGGGAIEEENFIKLTDEHGETRIFVGNNRGAEWKCSAANEWQPDTGNMLKHVQAVSDESWRWGS